jgi:hypothetical protein
MVSAMNDTNLLLGGHWGNQESVEMQFMFEYETDA